MFQKGNKWGKLNKGKKIKSYQGFQKGNKLWDNENTKRTQFPKGRISKPWLGKRRTEEWKRKFSKIAKEKKFGKWMKGRHNSSETEFKKGHNAGPKHPNWRGGITSESHLIRNSTEYKLWRKSVFERDNYTCIWCGRKGGILNADHIKPFAYFPELRFAIDNGRTLCRECHKKTYNYLKRIKEYENL